MHFLSVIRSVLFRGLPAFVLLAAPSLAAAADTAGASGVEEVAWSTRTYEPNPQGLEVGFWANYKLGGHALRDFGKRPVARVGFHKWKQIEVEPGEYRFGPRNDKEAILRQNERAHLNGSTMIANVNLSLSLEVNPQGMDVIPDFYPQRITNPETRKAAKKFLRVYVKKMLRRFGDLVLAIDYEFPWFYDFRKPSNRKEFRDWYVEACATAREAAAEIGKADSLRLMTIVNVDPNRYSKEYFGTPNPPDHVVQPWLKDIFDAADAVGMDIYEFTREDRTDPERVFESIRFWVENYAGDKPAWVTEVGMSTILETAPDFGGSTSHNFGTYAQQVRFYDRLLTELPKFNREELGGQLKGVCLWMYADRSNVGRSLDNKYGLVRQDNSRKPAWFTVKRELHVLETSPETAPTRLSKETALDEPPSAGAPVVLTTRTGTDYDTLRLRFRANELEVGALPPLLRVETKRPGSVIVNVNGRHWQGGSNAPVGKVHYLSVWPYVYAREPNTIELQFTGMKMPFTQHVESVRWVWPE